MATQHSMLMLLRVPTSCVRKYGRVIKDLNPDFLVLSDNVLKSARKRSEAYEPLDRQRHRTRYVIELLKERGNDEIRSPWPGPDREYGKGWVWGPYSPDRLLARTRAVYGAALEGYEDLATRWFSPFAPWLGTAAALPATLKGIVNIPTDASGSLSQPSILWYLEPRQIGAPSAIDIVLGTTKLEDIDADALWDRYRSARPDRPAASGFVCDSVLDIFGATPVTELVYDWLWNDLRQIGWVEGLFATRYW